MSILNKKVNSFSEPEVDKRAKNLIRVAKSLNDNILSHLEQGIKAIWGANNPQDILDHHLVGVDAKELFEMNTDIVNIVVKYHTPKPTDSEEVVTFKMSVLEKIQKLVGMIKPHTVNNDGTVTITTDEEPVED
jgi:hypothetical protein